MSDSLHGPLAGIRVLDLTRVLAGPYCSLLLAQLGAEIIKVEEPAGDHIRTVPPFIDWLSTYFASLNYSKKSVVLDLKRAEAREVFLSLTERSDVVVENFRPGVMDRLGIGYEQLTRRNPRLVFCSVTGFGQETTWRDRAAYDLTIQALGGLMSITGEPGQEPVRCGYPMGDLAGGVFGAIGIAAALFERERTGRGDRIDVALLDAQMTLMTYIAGAYFATGKNPEPVGSGHPSVMPYHVYRGSDRLPFVIAVFNEHFWHKLCAAIERPELRDESRFKTNRERLENRAELHDILAGVFATRDRKSWLDRLDEYDVPHASVNKLAEATGMPSLHERGTIQTVQQPHLGEIRVTGAPYQFSRHERGVPEPVPVLGEHTREVLETVLGLDRKAMDRLEAIGAVLDAKSETLTTGVAT